MTNLINLTVDFAYDPTCFAPPFAPCTAGTSESSNVDAARIEGWEGELVYDSDRAFARVSFSSFKGTNTADGSDLGALTPDRLALNFGVKVPEWKARFGTRIQVADDYVRRDSDAAGGFVLADARDGYTIVDLYSSWSPSFTPGVRFDIGVDNVFDADYERVFAGVSEPARNLKVAATWQFGS